jgi:hypothetical protein
LAQARRVEICLEPRGGDFGGMKFPCCNILGDAPRGARNLVLAAVIERNGQMLLIVMARARLGVLNDVGDVVLKADPFADHPHANAFRHEPIEVARHIEPQQIEQRAHLLGGPAPILGREPEHRQMRDAEFAGSFHRAPQRFNTLGMPERARTVALLRPAAVAVHDDGDVPGHKRRRGVGSRLSHG